MTYVAQRKVECGSTVTGDHSERTRYSGSRPDNQHADLHIQPWAYHHHEKTYSKSLQIKVRKKTYRKEKRNGNLAQGDDISGLNSLFFCSLLRPPTLWPWAAVDNMFNTNHTCVNYCACTTIFYFCKVYNICTRVDSYNWSERGYFYAYSSAVGSLNSSNTCKIELFSFLSKVINIIPIVRINLLILFFTAT